MESKNELGHEVKKTLEQLAALRGEIQVRLHLAGMDVRDAWNRVEPKLASAESLAAQTTEASRKALRELASEVKKIRDALSS